MIEPGVHGAGPLAGVWVAAAPGAAAPLLAGMVSCFPRPGPAVAGFSPGPDPGRGRPWRMAAAVGGLGGAVPPGALEAGATGLWAFSGRVHDPPAVARHYGVEGGAADDGRLLRGIVRDHGIGALAGIDGTYVVAYHDGERLWLASDPLGTGRLYYSRSMSGVMAFASQLKALVQACPRPPLPDLQALVEQQIFGYPLLGRPYLDGIARLSARMPLVCIEWSGSSWRVLEGREAPPRATGEGGLEPTGFPARLAGSAEGDGTVILLSGGLDSTVLAHSLRHAPSAGEMSALTFGDSVASDDLAVGRSVARALNLPHHELVLDPGEALALLPQAILSSEAPVASPGLLLAARRSRELGYQLVVGEGADQVFGGSWFLRFPVPFRCHLVARYVRACARMGTAVPALTEELRRRVRWLGHPDEAVLASRLWDFELRDRLPHRSLQLLAGATDDAGLDLRLPYLDSGLAAAVAADPVGFLHPYGWKPWLRRTGMRVLAPEVASLVLGRPKTPLTASLGRFAARVDHHARRLVPADRLATHPLGGILGTFGSSPTPAEVLLVDLFTLLFSVHGGAPPGEVLVEDLYRDVAQLSAVDAVLAQVALQVPERGEDPTDPAFVARALGATG